MARFAALLSLTIACLTGALGNDVYSDASLNAVKLEAADGSIKANFMPHGATTTNVWVKDKQGKFRDILLGFDNHTLYKTDELGHPYFGPIVGRYANRIKNGTFTIPISRNNTGGEVYHTPLNEKGLDTLHGGTIGFDRRNWTVAHRSKNSVTFSLVDPDGMQGFPGEVHAKVTYTLHSKATWEITMHATATKETPILLSGHHYWNLEAYQETQNLDGHFAQIESSKVIGTDGILIPTGELVSVNGTPADFRTAKSLGAQINKTTAGEFCGTGCVGFDNCWIYDKASARKPVFSVYSINSGIKLDVTTDQPALQVYTCDGIFNASLPIPRKHDQGGGNSSFYQDHSCLVVEQEGWIDGINQPEWKQNQIYGPKRDYHWEAKYEFSIVKD